MSDKPQDEIAKNILSYFDQIIWGYLVNDVNSLLNDELDKKEQGGCTAPLAMTIFSAMNQLGYLTNKKETKEIIEKGESATETCIKAFCDDWMSKVDKIYRKTTIQEMFVNLFRNGIAHQFLSIYSTGITRDPKQTLLLNIHEDKNGNKFYVLQIKMLAVDFLKAIEILYEKINKAIENNFDFIQQFYNKMVSQREKYLRKNAELFGKIERNFERFESNDSTTTTNTTTTSGIEMETTQTVDRSFEHLDLNKK